MKVYWDASALVWCYRHGDLAELAGVTRPHSLAELFSALSGTGVMRRDGGRIKLTPAVAAGIIGNMAPSLEFVQLTAADVLASLEAAEAKGVQGGRVHDLLHAVAAEKAGRMNFGPPIRMIFAG